MGDHLVAHERAAPMKAGPTGPLQGVRVLDLTRAIAGPWCTMLLADLGADVVKVEPPHGDPQRALGPYTLDDGLKAYGGAYGSYNRNKRSIMLDLTRDEDRDVLLGLVEAADALVENMRAGVMDGLGLSYEVLRERNPRLVYGAVRGFGDPRTGASPYADWPSYDVVAQAMGGFVAMNGLAPDARVKAGPFVGDVFPGTIAALAVAAALFHAARTGEGQFVDVGMADAVMALCENGVMRYSYAGRPDTPPTGNGNAFLVPFDIFPTADGSCAIGAPTDHHWRRLAAVIGRPDLAADPRTARLDGRVAHRAIVDEVVGGWARAHTTAEVVAALGGLVPVGPVNRPGDLFDDPHVAARGMLVAVDQPAARPVVQVDTPMRFTATPAGVHRRAPVLDEHRDEVLAELAAWRARPGAPGAGAGGAGARTSADGGTAP